MSKRKKIRVTGIILLFGVVGWAFYLHLPLFNDGYLNAGDDHVHVAFSNELNRIWQGEGRTFGWSRLYGAGAPIFLLRPPLFYQLTCLLHALSTLTIEESLKTLVILGFCLFPLTFFIGTRLLGVGLAGALFAALLSPMGISLWGHTIDAYQHLGVHKQLIAILFFPLVVGSFWQVLKNGKYGLLFAASFAVVFMSHPYMAYCFALLVPLMLIALTAIEPQWHWKRGISQAVLWSIPLILWIGIWLLPFVTSQEIQIHNPYADRRDNFDVVVLTTAQTLKQYFLGGILDTTRFAGPFGANEWGWRDNSAWFRLPFITALSFIGWLVVAIRPKSSARGFMALAFLGATILFIGPDDFPWLEWVPFSEQFQNIHAVFLFEWAAFILAGIAIVWLFEAGSQIHRKSLRRSGYVMLGISITFGYGTVIYERTKSAQKLIDLRNVYTTNGELALQEKMNLEWRDFDHVVQRLKAEKETGSIAAFPLEHEDSVLYNLLPLMVDRPVFICGYEKMGGLYDLLVREFRPDLRNNYHLQQLFDIRFVVNSPYHRKVKMEWHDSIEPLYEDKFWELVKVKGDFGLLEAIPSKFAGFVGKETEWRELMRIWLTAVKRGGPSVPWILNLTNSGLKGKDLAKVRPFLKYLISGKGSTPPEELLGIECLSYSPLATMGRKLSENDLSLPGGKGSSKQRGVHAIEFERIRAGRDLERFRLKSGEKCTPVLFKRAFYRGWTAHVDGEEIPIYRISPGLQMVLAPKGEHVVTWKYTGPNNWQWSWIGFCAGFVVAGILAWRDRAIRTKY